MKGLVFISGFSLALLCAGGSLQAADDAPPVPQPTSPITFFRELLAMTESERLVALAGRPDKQRQALLLKIDQYASMPASERELRLRATELRYFLLPMMRLSPEARAERMAAVPEELREIVEDRLTQWNLLPPTFQQQLLENQPAILLFSRMNPESPATADDLVGRLPTERIGEMSEDLARWQKLSPERQRQLLRGFNGFLELTATEQARTLRTLSPEERRAMDRTLRQFKALPPDRREACLQGFMQFVLMPPEARTQFLENADRWKAMPPEDREQWRLAVDRLSKMPPIPPGVNPVLVQETPPLPIGFTPPETAHTN